MGVTGQLLQVKSKRRMCSTQIFSLRVDFLLLDLIGSTNGVIWFGSSSLNAKLVHDILDNNDGKV